MKRIVLLFLPLLLLVSCTGVEDSSTSSSVDSSISSSSSETTTTNSSSVDIVEEEPIGELQRVFSLLAEGNFHIEYTLSYASQSSIQTQTADYTNYAIETDGYFGFTAVAQGDGFIFPYTRNGDQIESKAPSINNYTGMRYETLADYRSTFRDFDWTYLETEADEDGYYTYTFGENADNDEIISTVCMLYSSSATPSSLKFKVIGNSVISYGVGIDYGEVQDTVIANISGIGTTEIEDIKAYLASGGTAKDYVSDRFVAFLLPYLISYNYSIDVDLTEVDSTGISTPIYHKVFTEYSEHSYVDSFESGTGFVQFMNTVNRYTIDSDGNLVLGAYVAADTSGTPMEDIWYEEIGISFVDVTASNLTGYMSEEDGVTYYHMTDTQLISAIANVANLGYDDSYYVSEVIITIDDYDTGAFTVRFDYYVRSSNRDLGTAYASFHSRGTSENKPVDVLLSEGDQANTQTSDDLQEALDLFREDNYRQYALGDSSIVEYIYNPKYTYYRYTSSSADTGEGYLIDTDGLVKSYSLSSGSLSVGNSTNLVLPGTSSSYADDYDMGYFSSPKVYSDSTVDEEASAELEEILFSSDNYHLYSSGGEFMWANDDPQVLSWASEYFSWVINGYGFAGVPQIAIKFHLADQGESNQTSRLTFYLFTYDYSGYYYYTPFTFFDLGNASVSAIDDYLSA